MSGTWMQGNILKKNPDIGVLSGIFGLEAIPVIRLLETVICLGLYLLLARLHPPMDRK
jgi:hypothetical protein